MIGPHEAGRVTASRLATLRRWQPRLALLFNEALHDAGAVRAACPDTFLVGRVYRPDEEMQARITADPTGAAGWAAGLIREAASRAPQVDVWQIANEVVQTSVVQMRANSRFHVALTQQLAPYGLRTAIGAFSVGNPHLPEYERLAFWQEFYPAMRAAQQHDGILLLHAYGAPRLYDTDPDWYLHRYERQVLPRLPDDLRALPYAYGEYGSDLGINNIAPKKGWRTGYGGDYRAYAADLFRAAQELAQHPQCLGAALYTHGCENCADWGDFDISGPAAEHLAAMAWPAPIEEEPMPTDPLVDTLRARLGGRFVDDRAALMRHPSHVFDDADSRQMRYLCLHHSQSARSVTPAAIARYHVQHHGWAGIGYHFVVRMGTVHYVGDVNTTRAHVAGRNDEALGICITGDYRAAVPTAVDILAARDLIAALEQHYGHAKALTSHRRMLPGHTSCPGDQLDQALPALRVPTDPVRYDKAAWALEQAARILQAEGYRSTHDYLLGSDFYADLLRKRGGA